MKAFQWPKAALPILTLALAALVLAYPRTVLVNLGAGDEPLARGFQEWERAGPEGRTMFRWSRDGSTIELPASVRAERLTLRVRLARFVPTPIDLTWRVNGRDALRQTVRSRGWHVETLDLGPAEGRLVLEIRSFDDAEAVGAAVDWVEISGMRRMMPGPRGLVGLFLLVVVVPMVAHLIAGSRAAHSLAAVLLLAIPSALWLDPAQGLAMVTKAAPAALFVLIVLALVSRLPGEFHSAFAAAAVAATIVVLALLHPAFYYPDVDTHSRLLAAIRHDPSLALDPSPYQQHTGAWTRSIAGVKVAFPYSPLFHVVAWPLALVFGDTDAIKILAAAAFGISTLLVHGLARRLGLGVIAAVLAQVLFVCLPVESSRLCLALFPAVFAQALELALLTFLAAHLPTLGPRAAAAGTLLMMGAQLAYTGSLVNVAAVVAALALVLWMQGDRTAAARILLMGAASTVMVAAVLYVRFLPVLWTHVLPYAGGGSDPDLPSPIVRTMGRLLQFFGPYPLLAALGFRWSARSPGRQVLTSGLLAGGGLLMLRGVAPSLVRDVKEIELLAAPMAIFAGVALMRMSERERGRYGAIAIVAGLVAWGLVRAVQVYQANLFVAF